MISLNNSSQQKHTKNEVTSNCKKLNYFTEKIWTKERNSIHAADILK